MTLSSRLLASVVATQTNPLDLGSGSFPLNVEARIALASGVGSGQADVMWTDRRTIAASGTDSLDLSGGGLTNMFGAAFAPAKIKAIYVKAVTGNVNNVNVTRPAANGVPWLLAAGDGIPVQPDGTLLWVAPGAGVAVTAGTGDLIDIVNSAGVSSVTYDIVILGTSA